MRNGGHVITPDEMMTDYGRAQLRDSRVNVLTELDYIRPGALPILKGVVVGDPISARQVKGNGFTLLPQALHVVATNRLPELGQVTEALKRRAVVIRFPNSVPEEEQDPFLLDTLRSSLPHLLRLCVEAAERALRRLSEGGPAFPQSDQMKKDAALLFKDALAESSVDRFIRLRIAITGREQDRIRTSELYDVYSLFCDQLGVVPAPRTHLKAALLARGASTRKTSVESYLGIKFQGAEGAEGCPPLLVDDSS